MIGACEWIFGERALEQTLAVLAGAGAGGIEVSGEPARDGSAISHALAAAGIAPLGTTAVSRWPTDERDLAHAEHEARRRAVDYYRGCVDLAAALGAPVVGLIPGAVGRVEPLTSAEREWGHAVEGLRAVALYAGERGVTVAVEAINRYETHLVNTVAQALELAAAAGDGEVEVGVIADVFHMQLEEADPAAAVAQAGPRLRALHLADSNRRGLGRGTLHAAPIVAAARNAGFRGPLVLECTAPGPNPFAAEKGAAAMALLDAEVADSVRTLRRIEDGDD
jgi:D-psicose/D-tagatose/L-ribulose 3-epimerase